MKKKKVKVENLIKHHEECYLRTKESNQCNCYNRLEVKSIKFDGNIGDKS